MQQSACSGFSASNRTELALYVILVHQAFTLYIPWIWTNILICRSDDSAASPEAFAAIEKELHTPDACIWFLISATNEWSLQFRAAWIKIWSLSLVSIRVIPVFMSVNQRILAANLWRITTTSRVYHKPSETALQCEVILAKRPKSFVITFAQ